MLKYEFYRNEIGIPQFSIKGELEGLNELGSCDNSYLNEIVTSLEQVINGQMSKYEFGYEVYTIECSKDVSYVIDTFNEWKTIAEISTQEMFELMRDWRDYLIEWESQNDVK